MMNIDDEDVNLALALGSTNYRIQTRLNNSSGAGVNADSRVDMAFAASDPLSELVWSPHNGLSLKCANSSVADKKPFLLWNVGPSSKGLSPSQGMRFKGSGDDNAVDQGNLTISETGLDADDIFVDKATLVRPSRSCRTPELGASHGDCDGKSSSIMEDEGGTKDAIQKEENPMDDGEEDLCRSQNVRIAGISKKNAGLNTLAGGISDCKVDMTINRLFSTELIRETHCSQNNDIEINASSSDIKGLDVANRSEALATKLSEALVCSIPNLRSRKEADVKVTSATGDVNKNKTNMPFPIPAPPLKRLESSAENDLCHLTAKEAFNLGEMRLPRENFHPVERPPTNSRICLYQEKGKEKALSEGDIYGRSSNSEDDSHESVESCNSAGLFSKGIKRPSDDQGLILGSKRMKKQIHGSPGSTSIVRPDSSFMIWISNMVKGLSDSIKEDYSSLALTAACSNDVYSKNREENFMCNKIHDSASLNMGFQSIFQSLYCRSKNIYDTGVQKENDSTEESRELVVADKTSLENLPGSCDRNNDNSCKQIVVSNKEVNPIIVGQPSKPWIFSADIDCFPYACESDLVENKASDNLVCNRAKDGLMQSDSLGKQMNSIAEKTTPDFPLAMSDVPEKGNPLTSLWITRFSTRIPRLEKCDSGENDVFPIDKKSSEARDDSADCPVYASEKEIHRFTANAEASVDLKSTSKLCPILPSQKFRSSEAIASVFARRLDALRHIIPSKRKNSSTCSLTCYFCGSGHDLRECPDVPKTELEDLLLKMSSFDRVEESSCLCIRCFQLDHWAISCPLAPSSWHWRSEQSASIISHYTACHLQLSAGNEKCSSYHGGDEDHKLIAADHVACSSRKPFLGSFPSFQTWNVKKSSSERVSASDEIRRSTTSNLANDVKDNKKFPLCNTVTAQSTFAPSEIFHAIRNLRLSRADILRWMNSNVSLSYLNGFFLRLRLGKLQTGLGGTSYYVACITGDAREHNGCRSKKSILVDVGGIKSSVGSQYVSNHDFLEDEIKAWWCRIVDSGCRIPSLDELNSKLNDRNSLGF